MEYLIQKQTLDGIGDAVRSVSEDPNLIPVRNLAAEIRGLSSLNFRVVGGTEQPTNPRENDIWVQTDTAISGWELSAVEPAGAEGAVWIAVGTQSQVAFNAVKKNAVYVYPISCKQYTDGAWENRIAYIYQSNTWMQFSELLTYLYNAGDLCEAITGGWTNSWLSINGNEYSGKGTFGETTLILKGKSDDGAAMGTVNKLDLTEYTTLHAQVTANSTKSVTFGASTSRTVNAFDASVEAAETTGEKEITVDISELSGNYYVKLYGKYNSDTVVHRVWLTE